MKKRGVINRIEKHYKFLGILLLFVIGIIAITAAPVGTKPIPGHNGSQIQPGTILGDRMADNLNLTGNVSINDILNVKGSNVGIGTTNPATMLHIGTGSNPGTLRIVANYTTASTIQIRDKDNTLYGADMGLSSTGGDFVIGRLDGGALTEAFRIQRSSGNVGIGTTSPTTALDVVGVISPREATKTLYGGMVTEVSSQVIDFGMNEGSANRFGGAYNSSIQGGMFMIDTRAGQPLFHFWGRQAGTAGASGTELMSITNSGNVAILGVLSKGSGSFLIDHPLDPKNKVLRHSFVESPDMINIYNGNIFTDNRGYAIVKLPEYFEALNKDFKYQLTVMGDFAQMIVSEEIKNNEFVIRTDKPNMKVSWQVTGVRQDAFAQANPIVVEEEKGENNEFISGEYIHPDVFE